MKILLIGPIPPPMTGNALPVKVLHDSLKEDNKISIINLSKKNHKAGVDSINRVMQIVRIFFLILKKQKKYNVLYFTIAESFAGNLRDILIYILCRKRLDSVVIHMLGGAGMNVILSESNSLKYKINHYFLRRLGAIVVEGKPQFEMFSKVAKQNKIHIIPNFAEDYLFNNESSVLKKFDNINPLRILFLSNMLPGKGHFELLEAFISLKKNIKENIILTFAGKLVSKEDEDLFLKKIKGESNIRYLGPVFKDEKKEVFSESHVFCLPTYYPHEGQPFSIVEAYATGCVVITTDHSGIKYIFKDKLNGYMVQKKSVSSLAKRIEELYHEKNTLYSVALNNLRQSQEMFTSKRYIKQMREVLFNIAKTK